MPDGKSPEEWAATVRTLAEARDFVLSVGICGILADPKGAPTLWDAIDAPEKQPGESGWGEKMGYVWSWKNELPATYPDEIFYGKRKAGAILCSMPALRTLYAAHHVPESKLSDLSRKLLDIIRQGPVTNAELKNLSGMAGKANKSAYDRALNELQITYHIARVNRIDVEGDTWVEFTVQYPEFEGA
jgi:hypothetical protein